MCAGQLRVLAHSPHSTRFRPRPLVARNLLASLGGHLTDRDLLQLYAIGALLMGGFVALYNYVGYHLLGAPYGLSQAAVGWIFVLYLVGTFSSDWMGRLADGLGRGSVLWIGMSIMLCGVCMTLASSLGVIIFGMAVLTFGFFGAHSIASGWVGQRALIAKAQASAPTCSAATSAPASAVPLAASPTHTRVGPVWSPWSPVS